MSSAKGYEHANLFTVMEIESLITEFPQGTRVDPVESRMNFTGGLSHYYYRLFFPESMTSRIRCESYVDESRAAEVHVFAGNILTKYSQTSI